MAIRESTPTFVAMRVNTHICGDSQGKTRVCKSIQKEEKEEKEGKAEGAESKAFELPEQAVLGTTPRVTKGVVPRTAWAPPLRPSP